MTLAPAADHVLAVLSLLARHPEPLSAASIAERLQLPRSTVYRLLGILGDRGFVTHLPEERRYGLGLAAYELGPAYQRQEPLQRLARPIVRRLVDTTAQNAHLAVLRGSDVVYVLESARRAARRWSPTSASTCPPSGRRADGPSSPGCRCARCGRSTPVPPRSTPGCGPSPSCASCWSKAGAGGTP